MRMNARYKVVSFLLTFIAASMAFVGLTGIFEYGYAADVVILASVVFLFVEGWRMLHLDAYLSIIERRIKEMTKISTDGWETYLRSLGSEGEKPTKWLSIALVVLIAPIYTIFNYVASFLSGLAILTVNESQLLTIRWAFFILMEIPIMICIFKALPIYKAWTKAVPATLALDAEPNKMSKESAEIALVENRIREEKMSARREILIEEYRNLNKTIENRGSSALLLDSIMIPSSLLLVSFAVVNRLSLGISLVYSLPVAGFVPLLTLSLIIVPYFFHYSSNKLDDVCFGRIQEIEDELEMEGGNLYVLKMVEDACWYKWRKNMWHVVFWFLTVAYIFISIWLFRETRIIN